LRSADHTLPQSAWAFGRSSSDDGFIRIFYDAATGDDLSFQFENDDNDPATTIALDTDTITDGNQHCICGSLAAFSGTMTLYYDGTTATGTAPDGPLTANQGSVGNLQRTGGIQSMIGFIDDFYVWDIAISTAAMDAFCDAKGL
jgi:hypothetical protein